MVAPKIFCFLNKQDRDAGGSDRYGFLQIVLPKLKNIERHILSEEI